MWTDEVKHEASLLKLSHAKTTLSKREKIAAGKISPSPPYDGS